jgi:hypothetical protein
MPGHKPIEDATCIYAIRTFANDAQTLIENGRRLLRGEPEALTAVRTSGSIMKGHVDTLRETLASYDPNIPLFRDFAQPWETICEVVGERLRVIVWAEPVDLAALGPALDRLAHAVRRLLICAPAVRSPALPIDSTDLAPKPSPDQPAKTRHTIAQLAGLLRVVQEPETDKELEHRTHRIPPEKADDINEFLHHPCANLPDHRAEALKRSVRDPGYQAFGKWCLRQSKFRRGPSPLVSSFPETVNPNWTDVNY